ncbi:hypothetical protein [Rhodosalinus sp.]|uniref:hypothetical protein n=1 Tax=Rhodosalinus sp. TaxID=2047741 RepID=UPI00397A2CA0
MAVRWRAKRRIGILRRHGGIAAFIVPFMFFYNAALLMQADWLEVARACATAVFGAFLLSAGVQGWFIGARAVWFLRVGLVAAALMMIEGSLATDLTGLGAAAAILFVQRLLKPREAAAIRVRGAD